MRFLAHSLLFLALAAPSFAQQTPADSTRVYELAEVEVLPRPQNTADFAAALRDGYPPHLRTTGVGGTVQVAFVVGADGVPRDVRVVSTPDSAFNGPTVRAVSVLRFSPAQVQGRAVRVRVEQPITWRAEAAVAAAAAGTAPAEAPGDPENGYSLREVEDLPRLRNEQAFAQALAQAYPPALRDAGVRGTVQVRFRVEPDGTTSNHRITRSTNHEFDDPSLRTLHVMRFSPARIGGRPVRVWVEQPIQWVPPGEPLKPQPSARPAPTSGDRPRRRIGP